MDRLDKIYLESPFYGARQMVLTLSRMGIEVSRRRVRRLLRVMGLEALCPKPNLSKPTPGHKIYPYLMRNLVIDGPGQAWCVDITYIRLRQGFVYLVAILDWFSRKVLAWRLSNSLDAAFCVEALEEALARYGPPSKAMNSDQGGQFTGLAWIGMLQLHGIPISMDGRGRAIDNVFIERFWRSLKYEEVYRREYADLPEARHHIAHYIAFYNERRPHSSLGGRTPAEAHAALRCPTLSPLPTLC